MRLLFHLLGLAMVACNTVHAEFIARPYIAFVSLPYRGHLAPVHALAQELSDRGYDTEFITMDLPRYTASFSRTTAPRYTSLFPFQSICPEESMDLAFLASNGVIPLSNLTRAHAKAVGRCFTTHYKELLPAITHHFLQRRPDLVVADSMTYSAIVSA
jgi:hypothetical protein